MPDATSIIATITAIKNSLDVAKAVKEADYDLDKAILKEKIAILVDSLLDAKLQVSEIQDIILEKDKKILELEKAFELNSHIIRHGDAYYKADENEQPFGFPFCSSCWEINHKTIHLTTSPVGHSKICPSCKHTYAINMTPFIQQGGRIN